jgi:acyl dehydratase
MTTDELLGACIDWVDFPVEEGKIREFAIAVGGANPIYCDRLAARAAGHRAIPAPPTFSVVAGHWRDQSAMVTRLGLDLRRVVVGEVRWEYFAPVYAGDRLSGARVVKEITERTGRRGGRMRVITLQTDLHSQDGELAIRQLDVIIETSGEP